MLSLIFYGGMVACVFWLVRRYKRTGEKKNLQSAGALIMAAAFIAALTASHYSILYPEKGWLPFLVLFAGAGIGGLVLADGYEGAKKVSALAQVLVYLVFSGFIVNSRDYFSRPVIISHAHAECAKVVPGSSLGELPGLNKSKKEELAPRLAEALSSDEHYVRLGALYALACMPAEAAAALPQLIALTGTAEGNTLDALLALLEKMGPAAAGAAPALETRLAAADSNMRRHYEEALKAIKTAGGAE